ncbi:MAG: S41 family peptidase [Bacteroides sp.]
MKHFYTYFYLLGLLGCLTLMPACSDSNDDPVDDEPENVDDEPENEDPGETTASDDEQLNKIVHEFLGSYYLWNDEYKALTFDYTKDYQSFFYDALMSLKSNTLDRRAYTYKDENGATKTGYTLFSYIEEVPDYTSTRATGNNLYKKEKEMSYGLLGLLPYAYKADTNPNEKNHFVRFMVKGVYPDSPADKAGIERGHFIDQIDGKDIRVSNWEKYYYALMSPTEAASHTLGTRNIQSDNTLTDLTSKTISCSPLYLNPVIKAQVETVSGHKVGYLFYYVFDGGYDEELLAELKKFKQEGITDLVLDLRYNLGGHVVSANLLSTCIAGAACEGKSFAEYRFNDTRMKALGNKRKVELFGEKLSDDALKSQLADAQLNLSNLYVLVSDETASSSELVINSLEGIDLNVFLIGTTTRGKNVGMEIITVGKGQSTGKELKKTYEIAPITFQTYNAKGFGDYEKGFEPNLEVDEINAFNQENMITVYRPLGSQKEYLYGFALEQITGETIVKRPTAETRGLGAPALKQLALLPLPARSERGMITRWEE